MDTFSSAMVKFLSDADIIPAEVKTTDTDREKTYFVAMPTKPDNVVVFNVYHTSIASLTPKNIGVKRVQILVRNKSRKKAFAQIQKLYFFLLDRPEFIENISADHWVIFDVREGPVELTQEDKGNYIWSLSFPVKTNIF